MKYSGVFHLGVHQATLAAAGIDAPAVVRVSLARDDEPLPTDTVPPDLTRALKQEPRAAEAWKVLRPSARREHVKSVVDAKRPETRARRIAKIIAALTARR